MNWNEVNDLKREGFRIGSHTHKHILMGKTEKCVQLNEVRKSIKTISKKIKLDINHLAYPNGSYNDAS